ncbi:MAG: PAS-domain containing protein [Pseudomonadota bacterium]
MAAALAGGLAGGAMLGAWLGRRLGARKLANVSKREREAGGAADAISASFEAFDTALILVDDGRASLIAGADALAACAGVLGLEAADGQAVIDAMALADPDHGRRLTALMTRGEPFAFDIPGRSGGVSVEGRSAGALAWLRLRATSDAPGGAPGAARLTAFVDAWPDPAWIAAADGVPVWGNRAWLEAVGRKNRADAVAERASFDRGADAVAREAAASGERREVVLWTNREGGRRALRIQAEPIEGGGVAVWTRDITGAETAAETFERQAGAHEAILNRIGDAVALFGRDRRLVFHNPAFAALWDLEPAWLADRPRHGEWLDRLRQRRRLPETGDYARFKDDELKRHQDLAASPEAVWRLPDERTLRVVSQPHPTGGLVMVFSDITPELRLKTQFNHLIQVQRATLDKLSDAVAVFGSDARLKLHNEAFETFWAVTAAQLAAAPDFDGVVELCVRRLHDRQFWRDLKARIADPDPVARTPVSREVTTADRRIVAFQSRPLPDGATLVSFTDVTDTRALEAALADRQSALDEAERLKREFVGSVSYELRTPLTTIIGYSELLGRDAEGLTKRGLDSVGAIKSAAVHLARSINNVLDMAEIDAGELVLEIDDVDVAGLIGEAAGRWASEARQGAVAVTVVGGEAGLIRGDARRLGQVLGHLTENALRRTPPGGTITLSATRALGEVALQVSNTGRGIPFDIQAHIFDRFGAQDRAGPGLALALVKALVELHGGWVALESDPTAGAAFTCHLPESASADEARPELF